MVELEEISRAILILHITSLEDINALSLPIISATSRTQSRLLIAIFTPIFDNASRVASWDAAQMLLTYAYLQATKVTQKQDKILMSIDVILRSDRSPADPIPPDNWDVVFYGSRIDGLPTPEDWLPLPSVQLDHNTPVPTGTPTKPLYFKDNDPTGYPVVAVGGTFDHLHAGHKILLSMSAWITQEKIIVGVTDTRLLVNKLHKDLLEDIDTRRDHVREFLRLFKPGLIYEVVPMDDIYGPTRWDPNIQALVVSKETLPGADAIASLRAGKSYPLLETFVIDVISASSAVLDTENPEIIKEAKMSSTFIRQWINDHKNTSSER